MPNAPFRANRELAIHAPDLARAESFYCGVLGFRVVARSAEQLELDAGALRLFVNRDDAPRSYIPSLDVDDYDAARRHLEAAGCLTVAVAGHPGAVYFTDPFGFVFDVVERRDA